MAANDATAHGDGSQWAHRLDLGALVAAGALTGFGIIMWIAANWDAFGKSGRFAIIFAALLASAFGSIAFERARVAFTLAGIMSIGALMALIGQTYQSGADPWQLFALWAALALPWTVAARHDAVWSAIVVIAFAAIGLWLAAQDTTRFTDAIAVLPAWLAAFTVTGVLSRFSGLEHWTGATRWAFRLAATLTAVVVVFNTLLAIFNDASSDIVIVAGFAVVALSIAAIVAVRPLDSALLCVYAFAFDVLVISVLAYALFWNGSDGNEMGRFLMMGVISALVFAGSAAAVLSILRRQPRVAALAHAAHFDGNSWPVIIMTSIGALLAAVPLLGFFVLALGPFFEKGAGTYIFGMLFLATSLAGLRALRNLGFLHQLAVVALVIGVCMIGFGLYRDTSNVEASIGMLVLTIALAFAIHDDWIVAILGGGAAIFTTTVLEEAIKWLSGARGSYFDFVGSRAGWGLAVVFASLALLFNCRLKTTTAVSATAMNRFLSGWIAAALVGLIVASGQTFMLGATWGARPGTLLDAAALQITWFSVVSLLAALFACTRLFTTFPHLRTPTGLISSAMLSLLSLLIPGHGVALLSLAVAAETARRPLMMLAAFAALWLFGTFYYWLGWPLTYKAYLMIGLGLLLGAVAWTTASQRMMPAMAAGTAGLAPIATTLLVLVSAGATTVVAGQTIRQKEAIIGEGRRLYVPLAPVDPRSLIQGDYMALRFALPAELPSAEAAGDPPVRAIAEVEDNGVARITALAGASYKPSPSEVIVNLVRKGGRWMFATDAWYFREGTADLYVTAKFGEFRVSPEGDAILVGLADEGLQALK